MISKRLGDELKMKRDFRQPAQEVITSVLRTSDMYEYRLRQFFRDYGLTHPQYNILRILRGADGPLPILEIANRLVSKVPGITGLIDKLEARGLVTRQRCDADRRVWYVRLSTAGQELLDKLDTPNDQIEQELAGHLTEKECRQLVTLLDKARSIPPRPS